MHLYLHSNSGTITHGSLDFEMNSNFFFFLSLSNGKRTRQEGKAKTVKCHLIAGAADSRGG